jgi:hypothetical protein
MLQLVHILSKVWGDYRREEEENTKRMQAKRKAAPHATADISLFF